MRRPPPKHEEQSDYCVLCGKKTEYFTETPIANRLGFIAGADQLCSDCHKALYLKGGNRDA